MTLAAAPHPWRAKWSDLSFAGKKIALGGRHDEQRVEALHLIELEGGELVPDVKRDTALVIVLGKEPGSATNAKAAKFNKAGAAIEVLTLAEVQRQLTPTPHEATEMLRAGEPGVERWKQLHTLSATEAGVIDFTGADLRGLDVGEAPLGNAVFNHADLSGLQLHQLGVQPYVGTKFDGATLPHAWIRGFENCSLVSTHAPGLIVDGPVGGVGTCDADFTRARLPRASFHNVDGPQACFAGADLSDAGFAQASFAQVDFSQANLSRATFYRGTFDGASFRDAPLRQADFINVSLRGADFRGADLHGANFYQSNLTGALFLDADVSGVNVANMDLTEEPFADARGAAPTIADFQAGPLLLALDEQLTTSRGRCRTAATFTSTGRRYRAIILCEDDRPGAVATVLLTPLTDDDETRPPFQHVHDFVLREPSLVATFGMLRRFLGPTGRLAADVEPQASSSALVVALRLALHELFGPAPAPRPASVRSRDVRQAMLAELQGGPTGVALWNARSADDFRAAQHFRLADLAGAQLDGLRTPADVEIEFTEAKFDNASLVDVQLLNVTAPGAQFHGATIRRSTIHGRFSFASLVGATLEDVDLAGSCFRGATFNNAALTRCDFTNADLCGVDLSHTASTGCVWTGARYNRRTNLPPGVEAFNDMQWAGLGRPPQLIAAERERVRQCLSEKQRYAGDLSERRQARRDDFMQRLVESAPPSKIAAALKMLKTSKFSLYADVAEHELAGVVASQTDPEVVYACRLTSSGDYACATQKLTSCSGQQGAPCKHLLTLALGLERSGAIAPETLGLWFYIAHGEPESYVDRELAADLFQRYQLALRSEGDWRPMETTPDDFYAV